MITDKRGIEIEVGDDLVMSRDQVLDATIVGKVEDISITGQRPMIEVLIRCVFPVLPNGQFPLAMKLPAKKETPKLVTQ